MKAGKSRPGTRWWGGSAGWGGCLQVGLTFSFELYLSQGEAPTQKNGGDKERKG